MRLRGSILCVLVVTSLAAARPAISVELTAHWDVSRGVLPTATCPPWSLSDTASPEDPEITGGALRISTSADAENISYTMLMRDVVPDLLVVEARVRRVSGNTSHVSRAPIYFSVTQRDSVGVLVMVGADEVFLTDRSVRQATAIVDTDGEPHTYRIEVTGDGSVAVAQDGVPILTGRVTTSASDHGRVPRLSWGEGSSLAYGTSEWFSVGHNATRFDCVPIARDMAVEVQEDTPIPIDLDATDPEGAPLSTIVVTPPSSGSVVLGIGTSVSYAPAPDVHGSDAFTYRVDDGVNVSEPATVTITIVPVNDAPVARDDVVTTEEDVSVTFDPRLNDTDADGDVLTIRSIGTPRRGRVYVGDDGRVTYVPAPEESGTEMLSYEVTDPAGVSATAMVTLEVTAVPDAPVARDDASAVAQYGSVAIDVLGNDADVDGDPLVVTAVGPAAWGEVVIGGDGTISYTAGPRFKDGDAFTYVVSDGELSSTATVVISAIGCGEEGLASLEGSPADGVASERIDRDVEPVVAERDPDLGETIHGANCDLVVPTERSLDG